MTNSLGQEVICGVESVGATKGLSYCEYIPTVPPVFGFMMIGTIIVFAVIAYVYDRMEVNHEQD